MRNVFIIGNGPSAVQVKLGDEIDAADVVVRLNNFQTTGFEQYVGRKTTLLFTCRLNEYVTTLHQFPEVVLCLLMNPLEGVTISEELVAAPNVVARVDWPEVHRLTPTLQLRAGCYPTTGLLAVLYTLRRFGHAYLVGFDGLREGNRHYWREENRPEPVRHDGEGELAVLDQLERLGLLTRLHNFEPRFFAFDGHAAYIGPNF